MRQPLSAPQPPAGRPTGAGPRTAARGRLRAGRLPVCLAAGVLLAVAGCGDGNSRTPTVSSAAPSGTGGTTATGTAASPTTSASSVPGSATRPTASSGAATGTTRPSSCVDRTVNAMSQAQRVGQLFMTSVSTTGMTTAEAAAIRQGKTGSVFLKVHTNAGTAAVRSVANRARALTSPVKGVTVGMLVATDQEGGLVQVLNGPGFSVIPSAARQGTSAPATLQKNAETWGRQLRAAGVTMNLAPVADTVPPALVNVNAPIGKLSREYGTDPATVASHSTAFLRGMARAGVVATAKHFPGLGRVTGNTDTTAGVVDRVTTSTDPFLQPFKSAIDAGVPFVMVSSATYARIDPSRQAVFSPVVLRTLLRGSLGFKGVIISDDLGQAVAVADRTPARRALDFFAAGGNVLLTVQPADIGPMTSAVLARLPQDAALRRNVDDSVRRVLTAKQNAGLLTCG